MQRNKRDAIKHNLLLFLVAAAVVLGDQASKAYVKAHLPLHQSWMPWAWLAPYFRFTHIKNTGAAFGLFQNTNLVLGILAVIIVAVLIGFYQKLESKDKLAKVALGMQIGGALGNLIDRIAEGQVTDFISVGSFPIFNIADSCVTVGVGLLILSLYLQDRSAKSGIASSAEGDSSSAMAENLPEQSSENDHE